VKKEFVRIVEKDRRPEYYDGLVVAKTKKEITAICQGPNQSSGLMLKTFELTDWAVEPTTPEKVKGYFEHSVLESERKLMNLEFDIRDAKIDLDRQKNLFKEVFG
jgi:hypothetical protein